MPQLWLEMLLPMSNMRSPIQLSNTRLSPQTKTEWKMLFYLINVLVQMVKRRFIKTRHYTVNETVGLVNYSQLALYVHQAKTQVNEPGACP